VEIANIYNNFQTAVAGAERVFEILDEAPEPADRPDAFRLENPRGDIVMSHVYFGYTPQKTVLKDISLNIPAGTKVAVVGPTGSGKTTLINLLTRFYDVSEGSIRLDGHDLREYRMQDLRAAFGVVLQDTALFTQSVKENIRYGHPEATMKQIEAAARTAEADGFISKLPEGYDTVLRQGGMELSQGERQLLSIARAVLTNAPILILDEATSSVDTVTEQKIRRAMLKICQNRTSFIIAHRLSTIRDSDWILLIENGEIAEQGTHDSLMKQNGLYAKMYRTQTGEA
jgi:ATP-binding cassette subfamily B protein